MSELEARIAVLESQQKHMEATLNKMAEKVEEMHTVLIQAKTVRWMFWGLVGFVGFLAGKFGGYFSFMSIK